MRRRILLAVGLLLGALMAGCSSSKPNLPSAKLTVKETPLYKLQQGLIEGSLVWSADGKHIAYAVKEGAQQYVVVDEKAGPKYDLTMAGTPIFSEDGQHVAYAAQRAKQWFVTVDGKEGKGYAETGRIQFIPGSNTVAYLARPAGTKQWLLVTGNKEGQGYEDISSLTFSPDGKHTAFIVTRGAKPNLKQSVVVDGVVGKEYDKVENMFFLSDGKLMYKAFIDRKQLLSVAGQETPAYSYIEPIFNSSNKLAYLGRNGRIPNTKVELVVDGKLVKSGTWIKNIAFSPDGNHLAFTLINNGKAILVVDGVERKDFADPVSEPTFSADGKHVMVTARAKKLNYLIVDGQKGKEYVEMVQSTFYDGNKVAYIAKNRDEDGNYLFYVSLDGKESKVYFNAGSLMFTPDSKRNAYLARYDADATYGETFAVVDGEEQEKYNEINFFQFSPDGKHVVYASAIGGPLDRKWALVIDGIRSEKEYEKIEGLFYTPNGKHLIALATQGKKKIVIIDGAETKPADNVYLANQQGGGRRWRRARAAQEKPQQSQAPDNVFTFRTESGGQLFQQEVTIGN